MLFVIVAACGGDDAGPPGACEDVGGLGCFEAPDAAMIIHPESEASRPPNLDCGPKAAGTLATALTLTGVLKDHLSGEIFAGADMEGWYSAAMSGAPDIAGVADENGVYEIELPAGSPDLFHAKISGEGALMARAHLVWMHKEGPVVEYRASVFTPNSADSMHGLVGLLRDPADGFGATVSPDCDGMLIENAVGVLSATSSTGTGEPPTPMDDVYVFYGAQGDYPAPVRRNVRVQTADNGLSFFFDVPPGTYYAQTWGYRDDSEVGSGVEGLTLVAEYELTFRADAVSLVFNFPSEGPLP